MREDFSEKQIIYEATMGALTGIRRILMLVSGLLGLFLFNIFLFYLCWDHARVEARNGLLRALEQAHQGGAPYLASYQEDEDLAKKTRAEIEKITQSLSDKSYEVPLVRMPVSSSDFSVAILLLAVALLLWLLLYQRRFGACLKQLARLCGWGVVVSALQYHFLLVGAHATSGERKATQLLIYGIPFVGSLQTISDVADLLFWFNNNVLRGAFDSNAFVLRTLFRLGIDVGLLLALAFLANRCYREYKNVEEDLTEHLKMNAAA